MSEIHWHFQFIAYNEMKEGGQIMMPVQIIIINQDSEAEALFEAKSKIERNSGAPVSPGTPFSFMAATSLTTYKKFSYAANASLPMVWVSAVRLTNTREKSNF